MKTDGLHTSIVGHAHAYTRSDLPWILSEHASSYGKLIHYLSGGGMRAFGRTVRQEKVRRRQRTFLVTVAALAVVWLSLLIF